MLEIKPIKAFNDNYIWLITQLGSDQAWVVDPGDAKPVKQALTEQGLKLAGILITHHHADHTGGVNELKEAYQVQAFGADVSDCTDIVCQQDDTISVFNQTFKTISVPGHTLDHVAFYNEEEEILFSGDTLFLAGCGRLFEGTPEQMYHSLQKLATLPDNTRIFCTHEYSQANLSFALAVEPDSPYVIRASKNVDTLRQTDTPSLPTTMAAEKCHNPFLRSHQPAVIAVATERTGFLVAAPSEVFAAIRQWKDSF